MVVISASTQRTEREPASLKRTSLASVAMWMSCLTKKLTVGAAFDGQLHD